MTCGRVVHGLYVRFNEDGDKSRNPRNWFPSEFLLWSDERFVSAVSRRSVHDIALTLLVRQRDGWNDVGSKVDPEDTDGTHGQRDLHEDEEQEWEALWSHVSHRVGNRLLQILEDQSPYKHAIKKVIDDHILKERLGFTSF